MRASGAALPRVVVERLERLPAPLRWHVERVRSIARELGEAHGADARAVDLAAAAHDLNRADSGDRLLALADEHRLCLHPVERAVPVLLHGPVAAAWLSETRAVTDPAVLDAVRWHTTGHPGMGLVAKIVYLADKLDPGKSCRYPHQDRVRALAAGNLDEALLAFVEGQAAGFIKDGSLVHPLMMEFRNRLLMDRRG